MALQALGDNEQALVALQRALSLAEPQGLVMMFVDEGAPMARLLYQAAERDMSSVYVGRLLAAFPERDERRQHPSSDAESPLVEPLSPREREVLHLIATGATNQEIANELVITVNTVKRHITHILGKFNVANRIQAITRARELGVIK